ncbi:MAG: RusA family crossover junction endodeoxyribonuclease [Bacilli bacterium]
MIEELKEAHVLIQGLEPKSAPRPRFSRKYGAYNDTAYTLYKDRIKWKMPSWRSEKKIFIDITFVFKIAKSIQGKNRQKIIGTFCEKNKDLDNLEKSIYDAMNRRTFVDDRQIVANSNRKIWGEENEIRIFVKEIE